MRKLPITFSAFVLIGLFAACGSDSEDESIPSPDAGEGGSLTDGNPNGTSSGSSGASSGSSGSSNGGLDGSSGGASSGSSGASSSGSSGSSGDAGLPSRVCKAAGDDCIGPTECCTGACVNNKCGATQCVPDKPTPGSCTQNGECCSGICTSGKCASVNGTGGGTCRTAGNPCSVHGDCCSKLCENGFCSSGVSFCTQQNEVCSSNEECCSGNCVKTGANITGLCGAPTTGGGVPAGCMPAGTVCGGSADAPIPDSGVLPCDQNCCSRSCGYFGAHSGFRVCQPPSGCKPTGEVCRNHSDCCGWSGAPDPVLGPVTCSKASPTAEFGQCDNGGSCREPGSICKPGDGDSCSAENNCCEHSSLPPNYCNNNPENCCNKDSLGIPRCLIKPIDCQDAGAPPAGTTCATSADCCGNPCIDNKCNGNGVCQKQGDSCTNSADCCPGIPCVQAPGSVKGICGGTLLPDGGVIVEDAGSSSSSSGGSSSGGSSSGGTSSGGTCALYGQLCTTNGDCCNSVPCTAGRCRLP